MRTHLLVFASMTVAVLIFIPRPVLAEGGVEPYAGSIVCLPDAYLLTPDGCMPFGPSQTLTELAEKGFSYPPQPLPMAKRPVGLSVIPFKYVKVINSPAPLYSTVADADVRQQTRSLPGSTRYLSYKDAPIKGENGLYYQSRVMGMLLDGSDAARATPMDFQGEIIKQTPRTGFGWILTTTRTRHAPGYDQPETKHELIRLDLIQVYDLKKVGEDSWVQVGVDEWVEDRVIARVTPQSSPPPGMDRDRWIEVNLDEQTLMVYDHTQLIFATMVATGADPFFTRPGLFAIQKKVDAETMSGDFSADKSGYYYLEDVPWTMYFDNKRALHGAYWHANFGYTLSHGCVNMSIGDARWLYDWSTVGEYVYVWDPSGKTPTDPSLYTEGGF